MEYSLRKYRASDREAVRRICADTALWGEPVDSVFADREIASDVLISYYTDFEPESCFVLSAGGRVAGYLAGSLNAPLRRGVFLLKIIPSAVVKAFSRKVIFRRKTFMLCMSLMRSFLAGEFFSPAFSGDYPAVLHINIDRGFRCRGGGAELLEEFLKYLKERRVKAVMLSTTSPGAARFFSRRGFNVLHARRISWMNAFGLGAAERFVMGRKV